MSASTAGVVRFFDGLERSVWTVAEGAGATGIIAGFQSLPVVDIPKGYLPVAIILVAGVLAGIKSAVAQRWGNGTAATLPADLEPVPASDLEPVEEDEPEGELIVDHPPAPVDDSSQNAHEIGVVDPDPDLDGNGHGDVTGRFKTRQVADDDA